MRHPPRSTGRLIVVPLAVALLGATALLPSAPPAAAAGGGPLTAEAENGVLDGVAVGSSLPGHSGSGYVEGFDAATDSVRIPLPDTPAGLYDLTVRYASPNGDKHTTVDVNGAGPGDLALPGSSGFTDLPAGRVLLDDTGNVVTVHSNWGYYAIDSVTVTPADERPPHRLVGAPVDPDATPEARSLLSYLGDHYGTDTLSGQQDTANIGWLEQNVGKAPAIAGLDLMDYSPSRQEHGATSQEVEHALDWDARGGITSFVWHWNAPSHLVDQPGKEWWRGFYTDATTFDLAAALADPQSDDYRLLLRDIDAISARLAVLQDAGVPVLWRPLHEAEGGWFWWGAKGPGPAKELYRLMYDRMVRHNGLHHLIWVWNSVDPAWYPGDDVVDVVSADSYPAAGDHGPVSGTYDRLLSLTGDTKPAALGEVGAIPDPALMRAYRSDWSWFVTWGGDYLTDGVHNAPDFLKKVYDDPHVITLDTVGDFKHHS
ncbi:glycosyl hydrolase [Streptomyces sp. RKAG290]|uniref:glycosyl hydrolase n=1 Tax=Streptomyces sp. RKAG290 TaxID=2888348 RepID=UPI0020347BEB|nr:glycosyl hydrolase [Streptomyces sp. RKAG290]MCM2410886.1 beta-mannanase [Streptomyces sp. RKAG290]